MFNFPNLHKFLPILFSIVVGKAGWITYINSAVNFLRRTLNYDMMMHISIIYRFISFNYTLSSPGRGARCSGEGCQIFFYVDSNQTMLTESCREGIT
jgi:cation transport ATPase